MKSIFPVKIYLGKKNAISFFLWRKGKNIYSLAIFRSPLRRIGSYGSGRDFIDSFLRYGLLNIDYVTLTLLTERLHL